MQAGYCVLVHSAAGGCGLNALAICLAVGAVPIGTVSSQDKVSTLCSLHEHTYSHRDTCLIRHDSHRLCKIRETAGLLESILAVALHA